MVEALFKMSSGNGDFGSPPRMPAQLSRLCVADPDRAGTGNCKKASGSGSPHTLGLMGPFARCSAG